MKIETLDVQGFIPAMHAMRAPKNSWARNDTSLDIADNLTIGPNDLDLSLRLQKAGPEHCKHLRMIMVWADMSLPLTMHKQLDTYRAGVEKVSTSTMHTLMKRELTLDDFEPTSDGGYGENMYTTIAYINDKIRAYSAEEDPATKRYIWDRVIQALPESFIQKRTVMLSYAALRNIVRQRKGHKLGEWKVFINWVHTLPYADELIFDKEEPLNA